MLEIVNTQLFVMAIISNIWVSVVLLTPYWIFKIFKSNLESLKIHYIKCSLGIIFLHWISCLFYTPTYFSPKINFNNLSFAVQPNFNYYVILLYGVIAFMIVLKKMITLKQNPHFNISDQTNILRVFPNLNSYKIEAKFLEKITLLMPKTGTGIFTFGFFKPVIVLPLAYFNHLSYRQAESIFLHELAHIFYADFLYKVIVEFLTAVLFFNPIFWIFRKNLNLFIEVRADNWAIQLSNNKTNYLNSLYRITKFNFENQNNLNLGMMSSNSQVLERFKIHTNQTRCNFKYVLGNLGVVIVLIGLIFSLPKFSLIINHTSVQNSTMIKSGGLVLRNDRQKPDLVTSNKNIVSLGLKQTENVIPSPKFLATKKVHNSELIKREVESEINLAELNAQYKIEPFVETDDLDYKKISDFYRNKYFNESFKNVAHDGQDKLIEKRIHQLVLKSLVVTYSQTKAQLQVLTEVYKKRTLNLDESLQLEKCIAILKKLNMLTYQLFDNKIPNLHNLQDSTDL